LIFSFLVGQMFAEDSNFMVAQRNEKYLLFGHPVVVG
jgi:hypothetical protein